MITYFSLKGIETRLVVWNDNQGIAMDTSMYTNASDCLHGFKWFLFPKVNITNIQYCGFILSTANKRGYSLTFILLS